MIVHSIHLKLNEKTEAQLLKAQKILLAATSRTGGGYIRRLRVAPALSVTPDGFDLSITINFENIEEAMAYAECGNGCSWCTPELEAMIAESSFVEYRHEAGCR